MDGDAQDSPDSSPSPSSPLLARIGGSIIRDQNFGSIAPTGPSTPPRLSYSRIITFLDEN
jgi:sodium/hydrogen antiporter